MMLLMLMILKIFISYSFHEEEEYSIKCLLCKKLLIVRVKWEQ